MKKNILTVAKFEYLRTIKRLGFWAATLLIPILMLAIMGITAFSNIQAEKKSKNVAQDKNRIVFIDDANLISDKFGVSLRDYSELSGEIEKIKQGNLDMIVYVPKDFIENKQYEIYAADKGIMVNANYKNMANSFLNASIIDRIDDPISKKLINAQFNVQESFFDKNGMEVDSGFQNFILPAISFFVFLLSVFVGAQYLLQSVSEEKENRMIETILSIIDARDLIWGKILGLSVVVLTQMLVWITGSAVIFWGSRQTIPFIGSIDIHLVLDSISFGAAAVLFCLVFCGFLLYSAIMVGVGSISTSQKDSQSLSSVFIIMAILPIYFIPVLISDPNGLIARFFSYFPSTSAFTIAFRNSLGAIGAVELALGIILNVVYVFIAFWAAVKLFNLGILMYSRRPSIKEIVKIFFK